MVNKIEKLHSWFAACLLFLMIPPYFMWGILENNIAKTVITLVLCYFFYIHGKYRNNGTRAVAFFIGVLSYYILLGVVHGQSSIAGVLARCTILGYASFLMSSKQFYKNVFEKFLSVYSVIICISMVSYVGAIMGWISPIGQLTLSAENNRAYTIFPLLVQDTGWDLIRFYGPFGEPGVVGTFGALLLCIKRFNFKDWRILVTLISGIISMSFFFYVLIVGYGIVYLLYIKRNLVLTCLLVAFFGLFYHQTKDKPIIYNTLWQRFEWDEYNNQFKGDTRKNEAVDFFYDNMKTKPAFWIGSSQSEVSRFWREVEETSSYKVVVVYNGVIFLLLYLSFFIYLAWKNSSSKSVFCLYLLVVIANMYQRPDVYGLLMFFLNVYFARFCISNKEIDNNNCKNNVN